MVTTETKECLGKCPYCGSENIDYASAEILDTTLRYPATCEDCDGEFYEDYNIVYCETSYVPKETSDEDWRNDNNGIDWNSEEEPRGV